MLKKLLYLYNDGHNPFPHGKGGLGYKPRMYGGMIHDEEDEEEDRHARELWEELEREQQYKEEMLKQYQEYNPEVHGEHEMKILKALDPTMAFNRLNPEIRESILNNIETAMKYGIQEGYTDEELKDIFDKKLLEAEEGGYVDLVYTSEYPEEEMLALEFDSKEFDKLSTKKKLSVFHSKYTKMNERREEELKEKQKYDNIIKLLKPAITKQIIEATIPFTNKQVDKETVKKLATIAVATSSHITSKNWDDPSVKEIGLNLLKDLDKEGTMMLYGFIEWFQQTKSQSKLDNIKYDFVKNIIMDKIYPKYSNAYDMIEKITIRHNETVRQQDQILAMAEKLEDIQAKEAKAKEELTKTELNKVKQESKQKMKQTHLKKLQAEIDARKLKAEQDVKDLNLLGNLESKESIKPKKVKAVKEVKPEISKPDLLHDDAVGRMRHIETGISKSGDDLEDYLTKNGQSILQYMTGDKSKIHNNLHNESIPNERIMLNNGKEESLRRAVTLDLFNNDNIFEIKNYKDYSIKDDIIPVQLTKLTGTSYFVPYYLKNGNLYNLELHFTDGRKPKFILPENPNGRVLHLVYRLSDGLYDFKPLSKDTKHVDLQPVARTTTDGKKLYKFKDTTLQPCMDHYGNQAVNIRPYLKQVGI